MSKIDWKLLCRLKSGVLLKELNQNAVALDDDAFKLSETQYCLARVPLDLYDNALRVVALYWACSEKAFRRAYFKQVEGDDGVSCVPPDELLPPNSGITYGQILNELKKREDNSMESASYRWPDGAFVQKNIVGKTAEYHFRSCHFDDNELPYAILWKMKTD